MKRILLAASGVCLLASGVFSQQIPLSNQYTINKFSLSPAYAGVAEEFQVFGSYRKEWVNIPGAPEAKIISANGKIGKHAGLGGIVSSESAGIFQNLSASLSYAYGVKFGKSTLSFGLGLGLLDSRVNLAGTAGQMNDPVVANNASVSALVLDAGFGILYRIKTLHIGVAIPRLISSQVKNEMGTEVYSLAMQEGFNIGYKFNLGANWAIDPIARVHMVKDAPLFYEMAIPLIYRSKIWIAPAYKKTSMAFALGGIPYNNFIVNYAYEFSSTGIMGQSGGTHEIVIGWKMPAKQKSEVPKADSKKPYYQWLLK